MTGVAIRCPGGDRAPARFRCVTMPVKPASDRPRALDWRIRWRARRHHPRREIRRTAIARLAARPRDARAWRQPAGGCRFSGARAASSIAVPRARIQSSRRSRAPSGSAHAIDASESVCNGDANGTPSSSAAPERVQCVCRDPRRLADSTVVLIDDVRTTGATLQACARALREADVREMRALTAARCLTYDSPWMVSG